MKQKGLPMPVPYRSFGDYGHNQFGCKVYKVPVDAGFTCPNIDGTLARGGCTYCNNDSFRPDYVSRRDSLEEQIQGGKELFRGKNAEKFLVYFQSYTNTHAQLEELEELYDRALAVEDVVGLCIGTRPDCVTSTLFDYLEDRGESGSEIWLELGLQSVHADTLRKVNRRHGFEAYRSSVLDLRARPNVNLCTHLMFGLPGETREQMKETVRRVVDLGLDGVKFHQLQVVTGTKLAEQYRNGQYQPLDYETYRELVVWSLKRLPDDVVIHRIYGDTGDEYRLAPDWGVPKSRFLKEVEQELPA